MTSEVTFRRAALSDRQGVLDIDRFMFDGLDYMPSMYTTMLHNPAFKCYVAETPHGKIVSFMALMVDAEQGFSSILSGRTAKEYQSKGIVRKLIAHAFREVCVESGQNLVQLFVATDKPVYSRKFWSDPNRLLVHRQVYLVYTVPHAQVVAAKVALEGSPRIANIPVGELNADRAYQVLLEDYTRKNIFRNSHFMMSAYSLPLPKTPKYMRLIASQFNVFASFKDGSMTKPTGISYASIMKGAVHVNVKISLFVYEHADVLLAHVSKHLSHLANVVPSDATVAIRFIFPVEIDKEVVKEFLRPSLGVTSGGNANPQEYMLLWREDVPGIKGKL